MARGREPRDWETDRAGAFAGEREVANALRSHPLVSDVRDRSGSMATPDFELTFAGSRVGLEVKEKRRSYSAEVAAVWRVVPEPDLLIIDEVSLRRLVWEKGAGYVAIAEQTASWSPIL